MINTLDGKTFGEMIISGANNLRNNKKTVDELNVFPVPDGDTGTNMSLTITAVSKEIQAKGHSSVTKAADAMSFAALRGARGNSGVILSQLFRGMSRSLKGKQECNAIELANAFMEGSNAAYKAVMRPTEGTILTVARESANGAMLSAAKNTDITGVLESALERGSKALARTPEMLPALKQAGVVDAGGQGWIFVLEGALEYLREGRIVEAEEVEEIKPNPPKSIVNAGIKSEDIKFKYCTEFIIEKNDKSASVDSFKNAISPKGDCMLVIDDDEVVKVHIHTNHPGFVLEEAVKLGEMINLKIDNMKHQHSSIIEGSEQFGTKTVPEENEAAEENDIPEPQAQPEAERPKAKKTSRKSAESKECGFVAVCAGKGFAKLLKDLGVDRLIEGGQTMNPSAEDIIKGIKRVRAKTVFVFPNNKNIVMAAQQAAKLISGVDVRVIPTTSIPQCISAMVAFNENKSAEQNEKAMGNAAASVKTAQITYAVRDTKIDGIAIHKNDIIGMTDGEIDVAGTDVDDVLAEMVGLLVDEDTEYITVYMGKDIKRSQYEAAMKGLEAKYSSDEIEVSFKKGGQPVYYYIVSVE